MAVAAAPFKRVFVPVAVGRRLRPFHRPRGAWKSFPDSDLFPATLGGGHAIPPAMISLAEVL